MTIEEMALAKANSLAKEIQYCANNLIKFIKVAFPKKKIFPVRDRLERVRRAEKKQAKVNMIFGRAATALNIATIMAKPIPRFFSGYDYKGVPIVGEGGNEIVRLGTRIVHFPEGMGKPGFAGPLCKDNILPKEIFEQKPCDPNLGLTS